MAVIYLTGMRGSGKTTIGKCLATRLDTRFTDLDQFLCQGEHASVDEIVARHGWPEFRRLETQYLTEAIALHDKAGVIATGGGIVLQRINRQLMRDSGYVVWLAPAIEALYARLSNAPMARQRPPLTDLPMLQELRQTADERGHLYRESADLILEGDLMPEELAAIIIKNFSQWRKGVAEQERRIL